VDKSFLLKIVLSAIAGFVIAALLVFFPGMWLMQPIEHSSGYGDCWYAVSKTMDRLQSRPRLGAPYPEEINKLIWRVQWIAVAEGEVKCLPFLLACSCIGPAILTIRRQRQKQMIGISQGERAGL